LARREFAAALGYWQKADPELPELRVARARHAALAQPETGAVRAGAGSR
jgi:hypothetical protein